MGRSSDFLGRGAVGFSFRGDREPNEEEASFDICDFGRSSRARCVRSYRTRFWLVAREHCFGRDHPADRRVGSVGMRTYRADENYA